MEFLWITILSSIVVWISDSHAKDQNSLKTNSDLFCPIGWNSFGTFCYKGFSEKRNFENAEKECVKLGGHLAAITSKELQDYLTAKVLLSLGFRSYIGLYHNESTKQFYWTDGSELDFTAWEENEPSGKNRGGTVENCVEMAFKEVLKDLGKWNDVLCHYVLPYICQKAKDLDTEKPVNEPSQCWWSLDGIYFRNSCFHFSPHRKTWRDAEKYCKEQYNGHLASVTDPAVQKLLHYELVYHHPQIKSLWIGLKLKPDEMALWSSGWYVGFNNWKDRDPREKVPSEYCAAMTREGSGEWILTSCDYHMAFICENSTVVPPPRLTSAAPGLKCPSEEWTDLGGDYCYIFHKTEMNWYQANFFCMRKGGTLASIHSKQEEDVIAQFVRLYQAGVHIGLYRPERTEKSGREFVWVDHSPVNYVHFAYGEPNSKAELCGEFRPTQEMTWNDVSCDNWVMVLCSVAKNGSMNSIKGTESDLPTKKCECLPTLAIVGVVVCVLVVIILIGIVLYNVKPWTKARRKEPKERKSNSIVHERPRYRTEEITVSEEIYENMDGDYCEYMSQHTRAASVP